MFSVTQDVWQQISYYEILFWHFLWRTEQNHEHPQWNHLVFGRPSKQRPHNCRQQQSTVNSPVNSLQLRILKSAEICWSRQKSSLVIRALLAAVSKNSVVGSISERVKVKVKLPGQAPRLPGGWGLKEFPDNRHMTAATSSALLTGRLYPQEMSPVHTLLQTTSLGRIKPMILIGNEPVFFPAWKAVPRPNAPAVPPSVQVITVIQK
jgi:hypothetical protein